MSKKKRKDTPFHIAHNYKQWTSNEGYKFWARDEKDAKEYLTVIGHEKLGEVKKEL